MPARRTERHQVLAQDVGARIRKYRIKRGLSQEKLAARSDLTFGAVSQMERGLAIPTLESLERVANALGVRMRDLVPDERNMDDPFSVNGNGCFQPTASDQQEYVSDIPESYRNRSLDEIPSPRGVAA